MRLPDWLTWTLIVIVILAWITSFIASLVSHSYQPPESINLLFSTIVGGLIFGRGRRGDGE